MTVIIYIYLYIEKFEVAWEPNGWKYRKTKNHVYNIFVEEPPLYFLQGGRKLALIMYIYIPIYKRSRLHERQTAFNIEKRKNMCPIFLDYLSFLWRSHLCISYRVAIKQLLLKICTHVRGCVSAKRLWISKNTETCELFFCISYLFCNRATSVSLTGWPQNII